MKRNPKQKRPPPAKAAQARRERGKPAAPVRVAAVPERAAILDFLRASGTAFTLDELIAHFDLKRLSEQEAFARRIAAMTREGQLAPAERPGALRAAEPAVPGQRAVPQEVQGKVTAHPQGYGFLASDSGGPDVFLPPPQMRGLMHGDRARVRITQEDARGRREGALLEVLERGTTRVVGRLQGRQGAFTVIPSSPRQPEVLIPPAERGGARHGQMVVAELMTPPSGRSLAVGRVVEVLGEHLAPGMEIQAAIRAHDLPHEWPAAVLREAAAFPAEVLPEQIAGRADLRHLGLVTIDGADARDFDDAVYAEKVRGGWTLWVAIADVSAYVAPGSALDAEAAKRGNSVYFPQTVIPMLPEALSNGLCSLNPQVDRLCLVCEMQVNREGQVSQSRFYPAVMRSRARLVYEEVAEWLEKPGVKTGVAAEQLAALKTLHEVFQALYAARMRRGAIDFEGVETKIVFGPGRKIEKIVPVRRTVAHRLVEECMIAANVEAAKLVERHRIPTLYRVHAEPDPDKVALLREFLAGRGLHLPGGARPRAADYAATLAQLAGREDAGVIQTVMLRSLMQARYSPDNTGHFGLALTHYAHFTSPIRRYPDLLLHRAIKHVLAHGRPETFGYSVQELELLGAHCSATERRADEATREVSAWLKCEFMQHRLGEEYTGIVSSVAPFGLFVELEDLYIEGLVHVSTLGDDYYEFDPRHQRLVGARSQRVYGLGQALRVKVARVNLDERKIDLLIVGQPREKKPAARGRKAQAPAPRKRRR